MSASKGTDFQTDITADPSKFEDGMRKAASAATQASAQIDAQFKKIGDSFNTVTKLLTGFTAVLAGGGALKKFISEGNEWNGSAAKMAKAMGISTEAASVLNVALQHIGVESDTYIGASEKLAKQIQSNGEAFDVLGVKTRDATGAYRPVTEVMTEVNAKLAAIKNPIEQNIAGMQIYGKGWSEVKGILKLSAEGLTDAEKRARELGLIVGPEGAAMSRQYSTQMRDLNLVGKSLEVQFGNALLPVFARVGSFMAAEGPQAGKTFGLVLEGVAFAASAVWLALKDMGDGMGAMAAQGAALLSGDLAAFKAIGAERDAQAAKNEKAYERLKAQFNKPFETAAIPAAPDLSNGPHYNFKDKDKSVTVKADKSRMGQWEAELAERKATLERQGLLEGQYREMSKADEQKYWDALKSRSDLNAAEKAAVAKKSAETEMAGIKQTFEERVAVLQTEAAQYKNNTEEKLRLERLVQAKYQEGTKEYEAAAKRIVEIERQAVEQKKQIEALRTQAARDARLAEVDVAERAMQTAAQLGLINQAELLQGQIVFEQQRNAIAQAALAERLQAMERDPDKNPVELERIHQEIEALERAHQQRLGDIQQRQTLQNASAITTTIGSMESSWAGLINKLASGSLTIGGFIRGMFASVAQAVVGTLATMAAKWMAQKLAMMVFGKALAGAEVTSEAAKAGAGGTASMAAAPFPLNLGAPGFGAAMSALAMAYAPMASASGGYDIPGSVNPIVQAHAREMILPAKHADVIRGLADGGGGGTGGATPAITYNDHSGRLTPDDLRRNAKVIADLLRDHARKQL